MKHKHLTRRRMNQLYWSHRILDVMLERLDDWHVRARRRVERWRREFRMGTEAEWFEFNARREIERVDGPMSDKEWARLCEARIQTYKESSDDHQP